MNKDLREDRGSITIFVLASCLFFLISVTGVQVYTKNKQIALEDDYIQIKKTYEQDLENEENIYNLLKNESKSGNITIDFYSAEGYLIPTDSNSVDIMQKFTVNNGTNNSIKSISYGWSSNASIEPENWDNLSAQSLSYSVKKSNAQEGTYYLWVNIIDEEDNNEIIKNEDGVSVYSEDITIIKDGVNVVITYPSEVTIYNKKVGQGETEQEAKANLQNNTNSMVGISSDVVYVEATDSYGNKIYSSMEIE